MKHFTIICISLLMLTLAYIANPAQAEENNDANTNAAAQDKLALGIIYDDEINPMLNNAEKQLYSNLQTQMNAHLLAEIAVEEGKNIKQFFVIKKGLKPCQKSPSTCYDDMADYYHESIYKLMRSIHAMVLPLYSSSDFDAKHLVMIEVAIASYIYVLGGQNTNGASCFGSNPNVNCETLLKFYKNSPVGREILNSSLDAKSKQRLIGIWFLRQTPYAIESYVSNIGLSKDHHKEYIKAIEKEWTALSTILSLITYASMPANIDWSKYKSK